MVGGQVVRAHLECLPVREIRGRDGTQPHRVQPHVKRHPGSGRRDPVWQEHTADRVLSLVNPSRAHQPVFRQSFHDSQDAQRNWFWPYPGSLNITRLVGRRGGREVDAAADAPASKGVNIVLRMDEWKA